VLENGWVIAVLAEVSLLPLGVALLGFLRLVVTRARGDGADHSDDWRRL
jgi:hypothetical protein